MEQKRFRPLMLLFPICLVFIFTQAKTYAQGIEDADYFLDDEIGSDYFINEEPSIADPLEPINRIFFSFNDKLYFWFVKPVSQIYSTFVPMELRRCVNNVFDNILAPVRIVNNLLQGNARNSGKEVTRFFVNSTLGVYGMVDVGQTIFDISAHNEDLGQTLGAYGLGEGLYICWPIIGPSSLRDTIGLGGDYLLNPLTYLTYYNAEIAYSLGAGQKINNTSLHLEDYEQLIEMSFDPYIAMRDFYNQNRKNNIKKN